MAINRRDQPELFALDPHDQDAITPAQFRDVVLNIYIACCLVAKI